MRIIKLLKSVSKISKLFSRKVEDLHISGLVGVVEPSGIALEKNTIDQFNLRIMVRDGVDISDGVVNWGRLVYELPYTDVELQNLIKVKEIPIVERKIDNSLVMFQEPAFGEIVT